MVLGSCAEDVAMHVVKMKVDVSRAEHTDGTLVLVSAKHTWESLFELEREPGAHDAYAIDGVDEVDGGRIED